MAVGDWDMGACYVSPPAEEYRAEERGHQHPPSAGRKGRADKKAGQLTRKGRPGGRKPQKGGVVSPTGTAGKNHLIKAEIHPLAWTLRDHHLMKVGRTVSGVHLWTRGAGQQWVEVS